MSRTSPRALALATVTVLSCAIAAGPANAKTSKAEKTQNTAIKNGASSIKKNTASIKKVSTATKKADTKATAAGVAALKAIGDAKSANDGSARSTRTSSPRRSTR